VTTNHAIKDRGVGRLAALVSNSAVRAIRMRESQAVDQLVQGDGHKILLVGQHIAVDPEVPPVIRRVERQVHVWPRLCAEAAVAEDVRQSGRVVRARSRHADRVAEEERR